MDLCYFAQGIAVFGTLGKSKKGSIAHLLDRFPSFGPFLGHAGF
jgi:hypothetical protein